MTKCPKLNYVRVGNNDTKMYLVKDVRARDAWLAKKLSFLHSWRASEYANEIIILKEDYENLVEVLRVLNEAKTK